MVVTGYPAGARCALRFFRPFRLFLAEYGFQCYWAGSSRVRGLQQDVLTAASSAITAPPRRRRLPVPYELGSARLRCRDRLVTTTAAATSATEPTLGSGHRDEVKELA